MPELRTVDRNASVAPETAPRFSRPAKPGTNSRVLRVLHVTNSMRLGGTEQVVLRVAGTLSEGFEHYVCCIRDFDADLVGRWLRPEQFSALDLPQSRFAFFVPRLMRAIRACKPDIVHSRNWGAIEAAIAARLARVPVVIHSEHGYEVEYLSETPRRQRWMRRLVCSTADAFCTVSRELRDYHAEQAGVLPERIRVIYNGVDTARFTPNQSVRAHVRATLGIAPDDFVIGAVGRMVPIKDYPTLVRAAGMLEAKVPNLKLLLVGDGPEFNRINDLTRSIPELHGHVIPAGRSSDVPGLLAAMDVFVQTSLREGMSNTLLEAMATGLPAVVTRVGGNPEVVDEGVTGWLFAPGDVGDLSGLLLRLANEPGSRAFAGQAARRRILQMFSHETMLESYRTLYLELMEKRDLNRSKDSAGNEFQPGRKQLR
ncbi:MAG: glycosyltransferase [Actinomycetota bacterium]